MWDEITCPFVNFNGSTPGVLEMDKWMYATFHNGCSYVSILGLNSIHVSKMYPEKNDRKLADGNLFLNGYSKLIDVCHLRYNWQRFSIGSGKDTILRHNAALS